MNAENPIGYLVEIGPAQFVIHMIPAEQQSAASDDSHADDPFEIGQVGSFLKVVQGDIVVLVQVERMYQEVLADGEEVIKLRAAPLGNYRPDGEFERGVASYPTVGAEVFTVNTWELAKIFAKNTDANYKVGRLSSAESVNVFLDPSSFFGRHTAILGQTGSGKSWTVTSVMQSALKAMPNMHCILLDLHGEYRAKEKYGRQESPFPKDKCRTLDAAELEFPFWLLTFGELVDLFVSSSDPNAAVQTAFLRETVLALKREANEALGKGHITVDSPVYFDLDEMFERLKKANEQKLEFGKKEAPLHGRFEQMLVRLQSFFNDSRYDFILRPKKRNATDTLPGLMRDFVGLGEPKANITILDLSAVPFDVAPVVTAQIGRLAYEFNFWNPQCHEFPIFLICEEAHQYISREDIASHQEARRSMERIAKNGRKYGVGLCVVSQRPHDLSETVLSQCGTYICMRISNPDDQEYVRKLVPDASRGALDALTSLARGEAIVMGEAAPIPVRFRVTMPDPPPSSRDINYTEKWRSGPEDIAVEVLVNRWHRQIR